jgi:hypothetical protein
MREGKNVWCAFYLFGYVDIPWKSECVLVSRKIKRGKIIIKSYKNIITKTII